MVHTQQLTVAEIRAYFNKHTKKTKHPGIFKVTKPMKVWKKTKDTSYFQGDVIVALEIPVGALVHAHMFGYGCASDNTMNRALSYRKMRTSRAKVVEQFQLGKVGGTGIYKLKPGNYQFSIKYYNSISESISGWSSSFKYTTGKIVKPKNKFSMDNDQCASGVHFFINLSDAMKW